MSRLDRNNGKFDPFCSSITTATTPCIQLVRESKRYLIFPLLRQCCFCCDSAHGCGILKRDWLKNAKFSGKDELNGQIFNRFIDSDSKTDYWATTDSRQVPRKLAEGGEIFKEFILNTYSEDYIADSIFALPSYCSGAADCPASSECGRFRGWFKDTNIDWLVQYLKNNQKSTWGWPLNPNYYRVILFVFKTIITIGRIWLNYNAILLESLISLNDRV